MVGEIKKEKKVTIQLSNSALFTSENTENTPKIPTSPSTENLTMSPADEKLWTPQMEFMQFFSK